jgi:hypothetical protein
MRPATLVHPDRTLLDGYAAERPGRETLTFWIELA